MGYWSSNPNRFIYENFIEIPQGDHRVQVYAVDVEEFESGKKCFEITFKVSGYHGKLWYYLWFDPKDEKGNDKKITAFFNSFNIRDHNLAHYEGWIGKLGAVRVIHREDFCDKKEMCAIFCIYGARQKYLPPWRDAH